MGQLSCYTGQQVTWDQFEKSGFFYPPLPEDVNMDDRAAGEAGPRRHLPGLCAGRHEAVVILNPRIFAVRDDSRVCDQRSAVSAQPLETPDLLAGLKGIYDTQPAILSQLRS